MSVPNETVAAPPIRYALDGNIAMIVLANPPVNALGNAVRAGLLEALQRAESDVSVAGVVIRGDGRGFSGGADITELGKPLTEPRLRDALRYIETMSKPLIAAIHGFALGGGLELALGCHARIATPDAQLGQPEINLGLLPGAGGTQRLARVAGPVAALKLVSGGNPIGAAEGLKLGILDAIAADDLLAQARSVLAELSDGTFRERLARHRDDKITAVRDDRRDFEALLQEARGKARDRAAPVACIAAVVASVDREFDQAIAHESDLFEQLVKGAEHRALRHLFLAERQPPVVQAAPRKVTRAAVIGAGTMGAGIAMCFAQAGIPVALIDVGAEQLTRGMSHIEANFKRSLERGGLSEDAMRRRMALIEPNVGFAATAHADLIIEAVFEDLAIKKTVFAEIGRVAKPDAVVATNTSTLDVDAIAEASGRPADVIGMHFFSPANVMRLVEVVRGGASAADALATALAVGRKIGKLPVVVGNCDGFVGNRMLARRTAQAERLLLEGAMPADVDQALTAFGFPMGPFAMADLAGLDVAARIRAARGTKAPIADAIYAKGRLGQKSGAGYYRYAPGSRTPLPDPEIAAVIEALAAQSGVRRRTIGSDEILERLLYPMIDEGACILDEGIAALASDIDLIWVNGYGWPAHRGGPMLYADQIGAATICERLAGYAKDTDDASLAPAPALVRHAQSGLRFCE